MVARDIVHVQDLLLERGDVVGGALVLLERGGLDLGGALEVLAVVPAEGDELATHVVADRRGLVCELVVLLADELAQDAVRNLELLY